MENKISQLVEHASKGDATEFKKTFELCLSERINEFVESKKKQLSSRLVNETAVVDDEDEGSNSVLVHTSQVDYYANKHKTMNKGHGPEETLGWIDSLAHLSGEEKRMVWGKINSDTDWSEGVEDDREIEIPDYVWLDGDYDDDEMEGEKIVS